MTREELRDYVEEQRNLNNIPYHIYSTLIDGIDTLEQESCENWRKISAKPVVCKVEMNEKIAQDIIQGLKNQPLVTGVLPTEPKVEINGTDEMLDKIRAEIEQEIVPRNSDQYDYKVMWQNMGLRLALKIIDKYKESEDKNDFR